MEIIQWTLKYSNSELLLFSFHLLIHKMFPYSTIPKAVQFRMLFELSRTSYRLNRAPKDNKIKLSQSYDEIQNENDPIFI